MRVSVVKRRFLVERHIDAHVKQVSVPVDANHDVSTPIASVLHCLATVFLCADVARCSYTVYNPARSSGSVVDSVMEEGLHLSIEAWKVSK